MVERNIESKIKQSYLDCPTALLCCTHVQECGRDPFKKTDEDEDEDEDEI